MRCMAAMLPLVMLLAAGCSQYRLQGKVIEGPASGILLVEKDDSRLQTPGVSGAMVDLTLDPDRMGEKHLGAHRTDLDGRFSIPVGEFGAGMFNYEVQLIGRMSGFQATVHRMPLPDKNQRVLVVLSEGRDTYHRSRDIIEESLRIGGERAP